MKLLTQILDAISPPRGLTDDEHRKFRKSFEPTTKCQLKLKARIERTDDYVELCLRPMDFQMWRQSLAANALMNTPTIVEILAVLETDHDKFVRFRHYFASTVPSGKCGTAFVRHPPKTLVT
jgi:hypothetical protein